MGLSDPKKTSAVNHAIFVPVSPGSTLMRVNSDTNINQIRGVNDNGSTGSGIPDHITNISTSTANASAGSTSTVTVTFRRNPSDTSFGGVVVWAKGYQSNQTPAQVASGTDSPISFILNNTGESVSLIVQAYGNGGSAPMSTAPTSGIRLPTSTSGGFGPTTTTTGLGSISLDMPIEFAVAGSPLTANGTIVVTKTDENANTFWAGPASGAAAQPSFRAQTPADTPYFTTNASFSGPGITFPSPTMQISGSAGVVPSAANEIRVCQFILAMKFTISKVTWQVTTGSGGKKYAFAIYTADGLTKLIDTGPQDGGSPSVTVVTLGAPVDLNPGVYFFAQTADANGIAGPGIPSATSSVLDTFNANLARIGIAANTSVTGIFPSTLGAITGATSGTSNAVCLPLFE